MIAFHRELFFFLLPVAMPFHCTQTCADLCVGSAHVYEHKHAL